MEDVNKALHKYVETIVWDFIDIHGFINRRKGEITLVPSIILLMDSRKRVQMKDVAETLDVSNSTVTDYVNYLKNKGFVRRVRSDEDRRDVFIELTDKGKGWIKYKKQITQNYLDERMLCLTPEERTTLVSLLAKFTGNVET